MHKLLIGILSSLALATPALCEDIAPITAKTKLLDLKGKTIVYIAKIMANPDDAERLKNEKGGADFEYETVSFLHGRHSVVPFFLYKDKEDKDPLCVVDFKKAFDASTKEIFAGASLKMMEISTRGPVTTFIHNEEDGKPLVITHNDSSYWIDIRFWDPSDKGNIAGVACRAKSGDSANFTVGELVESLGENQIKFTLPQ